MNIYMNNLQLRHHNQAYPLIQKTTQKTKLTLINHPPLWRLHTIITIIIIIHLDTINMTIIITRSPLGDRPLGPPMVNCTGETPVIDQHVFTNLIINILIIDNNQNQVPAKCSTQLKRLIESQTSVEVVGTSREEVIVIFVSIIINIIVNTTTTVSVMGG